MKRRICVTTGTRADYGLLYWLMHDLRDHADFELSVVASAMHLGLQFGETIRFIREDGFRIDAEVPCLDDDDTDRGMGQAYVAATAGFLDVFGRLKPDFVVIPGDRFEALAAATAATMLHVPMGHIHGGEVTLGAIDDVFRHAITKMAHLHFTAAEEYRQRVIRMGEVPNRVFDVGAVGLDNFDRLDLPSREDLMADLGLAADAQYGLFTFHPATMDRHDTLRGLEVVLEALAFFPQLNLIMTKANSDPGGRRINERLEAFAASRPDTVRLVSSLGQRRYLAAMRHAAVVLGNSSSGIIEAPAVDVPSINIGLRQEGRLRAASIVDTPEEVDAIRAAITRALQPEFRANLAEARPPYGRPNDSARKILAVMEATDFTGLNPKPFYDGDGR